MKMGHIDNGQTYSLAGADGGPGDRPVANGNVRRISDYRGGSGDAVGALISEGEAGRLLLHNLRDVLLDDEEAKEHAIEGETNALEAIAYADELYGDLLAQVAAMKQREADLKARRERFERRAALVKAAIHTCMEHIQRKSLVLPTATLSVKKAAPSVVVTDEASIPSIWWKRADPELDKRALLNALKDGTKIPGAELSPEKTTLAREV